MWVKYSENLLDKKLNLVERNRTIGFFCYTFAIALFLLIILRIFVFSSILVQGSSMYPTVSSGDLLIVNKLKKPKHGDIIVFYAGTIDKKGRIKYVYDSEGARTFYIKRIIGQEGDVVYWEDGVVSVKYSGDDVPTLLDEGYVSSETYTDPVFAGDNTEGILVKDGHLFVMGDNRCVSNDSRGSIGQVDKRLILGVVPEGVIKNRNSIISYLYWIF